MRDCWLRPKESGSAPEVFSVTSLASASAVSSEGVATALGYLVGAGSLALYTPIVWRVSRQGDASGLTLSTWWLKLASYSCSDVYSLANGYPLSTYVETLVITAEAALVLAVVASCCSGPFSFETPFCFEAPVPFQEPCRVRQ